MVKLEVTLALAAGVTVAGENEQVVYAGRPEQARLIGWLNPPLELAVIVVDPL
jgi:hypothetical protein